MTEDARRAAWAAFSHVANWVNTQPEQVIDKKVLYAAVMEMRPEDCLSVRADLPPPSNPGRIFCTCGADPKKHQLETSFKLLAETARSFGYVQGRQESNAELVGRALRGLAKKAGHV